MLNIRMGSDTGGKAAIERLLEAYGFTTKQALSEHLNVSKVLWQTECYVTVFLLTG